MNTEQNASSAGPWPRDERKSTGRTCPLRTVLTGRSLKSTRPSMENARRLRRGLVAVVAAVVAVTPDTMNPELTANTHVRGTICRIYTSRWKNSYGYPGAAAYVHCSTRHRVCLKRDEPPKPRRTRGARAASEKFRDLLARLLERGSRCISPCER